MSNAFLTKSELSNYFAVPRYTITKLMLRLQIMPKHGRYTLQDAIAIHNTLQTEPEYAHYVATRQARVNIKGQWHSFLEHNTTSYGSGTVLPIVTIQKKNAPAETDAMAAESRLAFAQDFKLTRSTPYALLDDKDILAIILEPYAVPPKHMQAVLDFFSSYSIESHEVQPEHTLCTFCGHIMPHPARPCVFCMLNNILHSE